MGYLWGREGDRDGGGVKRGGCSLAVISSQCLFNQSHQSRRSEPEGRSALAWSGWCERVGDGSKEQRGCGARCVRRGVHSTQHSMIAFNMEDVSVP